MKEKKGIAGVIVIFILIILPLLPLTFAVSPDETPKILLVDDDEGFSYEEYYHNALNASDNAFDLWNISESESPSQSKLKQYNIIIWFTGEDDSATLTALDQANLKSFLDYGGDLYISSKKLGYDISSSSFFQTYLKVGSFSAFTPESPVYGKSGDAVSGDISSFEITGAGGADNADETEIFTPGTGATYIFTYSNSAFKAGLRTHNTVYLGFPFEAITSSSTRTALMGNIIDYLLEDNGQIVYYLDSDGDGDGNENYWLYANHTPSGYVIYNSDCNDNNGSIFPGATELCNGIDDNCNGETDEEDSFNCTNFYYDEEDDGFGTSDVKCLCAADGYYNTNETGDCSDENADVYPGAEEICNNVDDDCNASTQDGDDEEAPPNSNQNGVCNDTNATCVEGEWVEYLGIDYYEAVETGSSMCDYLDNDCDGIVDEGTTTRFYHDHDRDGYGDPSDYVDNCTAPINYTTNNTDCNDNSPSIHPGATELCNGINDDCDALTADDSGDTPRANTNQKGVCKNTFKRCYLGSWTDYYVNIPNYQAIETTCDYLDNDCDGSVDETLTHLYYYDHDHDNFGNLSAPVYNCTLIDGYSSNYLDCDDNDNTTNPNATEICDGKDNDCNVGTADSYGETPPDTTSQFGICSGKKKACISGAWNNNYTSIDYYMPVESGAGACDFLDNDCDNITDEGLTHLYYYDLDYDNFGNLSAPVYNCTKINGYSLNSLDCNDNSNITNPNATEICDSFDNDCDGSTDEGLTTLLYRDMDGDTKGNISHTASFCTTPQAGYVSNSNDCDDSEPAAYTNAREIVDGIDNDCDNGTDEGLIDGNLTTINSTISALFMTVGGNNNLSKAYSGVNEVEIFNENITIAQFNYNFTQIPLNISNLKIKTENSSYPYGYTLVNNLDLNGATKQIGVKRISGYNKVCILDEEILSISEFSASCNSTNEIKMKCPDSNGSISCNISNDNETYVISGLNHSGVKEFGYCGDSVLQSGEECDSLNLNNQTCLSKGFSSGTLSCTDICTFNTTDCSSGGGDHHGGGGSGISGVTVACTTTWNCTEYGSCRINSTQSRKCIESCTKAEKIEEIPCTYYTCNDARLNGAESDIDCGGLCSPCENGKRCRNDGDCINDCEPVGLYCYTKIEPPITTEKSEKQNETKIPPETQAPSFFGGFPLYLILFGAIVVIICFLFLFSKKHPSDTIPMPNKKFLPAENMEMNDLIEKTKQLIEAGKLDLARQQYHVVHTKYETLALDEKLRLQPRIIDLNIETMELENKKKVAK